jgi:hypothetical protein
LHLEGCSAFEGVPQDHLVHLVDVVDVTQVHNVTYRSQRMHLDKFVPLEPPHLVALLTALTALGAYSLAILHYWLHLEPLT